MDESVLPAHGRRIVERTAIMRTVIAIILLAATLAWGQAEKVTIIPVTAWPRVLNLADKQVINPSVDQCVLAGYRVLTAKAATPTGKRIATEKIVQDPKDASKCVFEITYEDLPEPPPPPPPEVLTNVTADKVKFTFTDKGEYRRTELICATGATGIK